jgi:hypothetical protein
MAYSTTSRLATRHMRRTHCAQHEPVHSNNPKRDIRECDNILKRDIGMRFASGKAGEKSVPPSLSPRAQPRTQPTAAPAHGVRIRRPDTPRPAQPALLPV